MCMGEANVFSVSGEKLHAIKLPAVFNEPYHPELIKRAALSAISARFQPKGTYPDAGREVVTEYRSLRSLPAMERTMNVDKARKPRTKHRRGLLAVDVAAIPGVVGGPKSHPPKALKTLHERINEKERKLAIKSAIAASCNRKLVTEHGHKIPEALEFPIIVESAVEKLKKTKEVCKMLKALKLWNDVERAKEKKTRAGKGKRRGRKYERRKSALIVVSGSKDGIYMAARNIAGIDVIELRNLNAEALAPGAKAGRLVIWSENAIRELAQKESA